MRTCEAALLGLNLNDKLRAGVMLTYPPDLAAKRLGIEKLLFGPDGDHLVYGALNLGNIGLFSYGACCVFLATKPIEPMLSFLEENSFSYLTQRGASAGGSCSKECGPSIVPG